MITTYEDEPCINCITLPMCVDDPLKVSECPLLIKFFYSKSETVDYHHFFTMTLKAFTNFSFLITKKKYAHTARIRITYTNSDGMFETMSMNTYLEEDKVSITGLFIDSIYK